MVIMRNLGLKSGAVIDRVRFSLLWPLLTILYIPIVDIARTGLIDTVIAYSRLRPRNSCRNIRVGVPRLGFIPHTSHLGT